MAHSQSALSDRAVHADHAIASVRVLTTGRAEQHHEHRYGSRLPQLAWVFFGRRWVPLPLQCFLIDHRDGLVLFDTGIDPAIVTDPGYIKQAIGRFLLQRCWQTNSNQSQLRQYGCPLCRAKSAPFGERAAVRFSLKWLRLERFRS